MDFDKRDICVDLLNIFWLNKQKATNDDQFIDAHEHQQLQMDWQTLMTETPRIWLRKLRNVIRFSVW